MIKILDYGASNMLSLFRALENLGQKFDLIDKNFSCISHKDILIIPGVGNFSNASKNLKNISNKLKSKKPEERPFIIGICLGMQLLLENSEEGGKSEGLGLIKGEVKKIPKKGILKEDIHNTIVGWESLKLNKDLDASYDWLKKYESNSFFHVHSYMCILKSEENLISSYFEDNLNFIPNIVGSKKNKIIGFQFHPEKSGKIGLDFLKDSIIFGKKCINLAN
tara:strand:+ start:299 stop:964 length:666 start_codon:yes stop_codon:yes gene_type:complete